MFINEFDNFFLIIRIISYNEKLKKRNIKNYLNNLFKSIAYV